MKFEWKKKIKALGKGYLRRTTTGNCPIETACGHAEAVHKTSGFLENESSRGQRANRFDENTPPLLGYSRV
jgi:hypothetical protein